MMRVYVQGIALTVLLSGCASKLPRESLEKHLPEEADYEGIVFSTGPWHSPGSREVYLLSTEHLFLVQKRDSTGLVKRLISVDNCPELNKGRRTLVDSIVESTEISADRKPSTENKLEEIMIMDGPDYKLQYYSDSSMTKHTLEGGGNAAFRTPWVDAALQIIDIGSMCNDS